MNEIKKIHLGRQQFTIAIDAYKMLRQYLDAIAKQVEIGSDVVEEVELRMAELLEERGITTKKVILLKDVEFLKKQLGAPRDFKDEDDDSEAVSDDESPRRLFRDTDNAMIAGVAAGLAKYFDIDAVVVRLIFLVSIIFGGAGVLIYIVLWVLVPEARTAGDRLSMLGKAQTVENIKEAVKKADVAGAAKRTGGVIAKVLNTAGIILLFVVGLPLTIGAGVAILGTVSLAIYFLVNGANVSGTIVAPIGAGEVAAFIFGAVALLCIFFAMLLVGVAMMRRRWQLPAWGTAALTGIFFIAGSVGGTLAASAVPQIKNRVDAMYHRQEVKLTGHFSGADLNGDETDFIFVPDKNYFVNYSYFGKFDTSKIHTKVADGKLTVDANRQAGRDQCAIFCINAGPDLKIEIHAPTLTDVKISGKNANFISSDKLEQSSLHLSVAPHAEARVWGISPRTMKFSDNAMAQQVDAQLNGGTTRAQGFDIGDYFESSFNVDAARFDITTDQKCDDSNPTIFLNGAIKSLSINGKQYNSNDGGDSWLDPKIETAPNCVRLNVEEGAVLPGSLPGLPDVRSVQRGY